MDSIRSNQTPSPLSLPELDAEETKSLNEEASVWKQVDSDSSTPTIEERRQVLHQRLDRSDSFDESIIQLSNEIETITNAEEKEQALDEVALQAKTLIEECHPYSYSELSLPSWNPLGSLLSYKGACQEALHSELEEIHKEYLHAFSQLKKEAYAALTTFQSLLAEKSSPEIKSLLYRRHALQTAHDQLNKAMLALTAARTPVFYTTYLTQHALALKNWAMPAVHFFEKRATPGMRLSTLDKIPLAIGNSYFRGASFSPTSLTSSLGKNLVLSDSDSSSLVHGAARTAIELHTADQLATLAIQLLQHNESEDAIAALDQALNCRHELEQLIYKNPGGRYVFEHSGISISTPK